MVHQSSGFLKHAKFAAIALISLVALLLFWCITPVFSTQASLQERVFDEVWETINSNFYDENFNGVDWKTVGEQYKTSATQAQSQEQFAAIVNQMLEELQTSHTRFYTPNETAYYQLLGIFQPSIQELPEAAKALFPNNKFEYVGIGLFTKMINDKVFVSAILDGSPAAEAGFNVGDEVLNVEGHPYQPIQSFANQAEQPVKVLIQRSPDAASQQTINVVPERFDAATLFLEAQKASTQVIERQDKRLGYIHIWSNAADFHQEQMTEELLFGDLGEADGLIIDLRDGWGGGSMHYLNFFTGKSPSLTNIRRNGTQFITRYHWQKPVVLLINEGSRSSKEIVAFGFQEAGVGTLVGAPTAGAVVAGRGFVMQDGSLLYVAVADVLVDGQRLEGKGVAPDILVPFPLEYAQGADPQREQAIATLLTAIEQHNQP